MTKLWYKSRTVWVSLFEIVGGIVGSAVAGEYVGAAGYIIAICGAIQAILRMITTQPLE